MKTEEKSREKRKFPGEISRKFNRFLHSFTNGGL